MCIALSPNAAQYDNMGFLESAFVSQKRLLRPSGPRFALWLLGFIEVLMSNATADYHATWTFVSAEYI